MRDAVHRRLGGEFRSQALAGVLHGFETAAPGSAFADPADRIGMERRLAHQPKLIDRAEHGARRNRSRVEPGGAEPGPDT